MTNQDKETLDRIKAFIPVDMESDFDLVLLQAYRCGVMTERQACIQAMQDSCSAALVKFMRGETE